MFLNNMDEIFLFSDNGCVVGCLRDGASTREDVNEIVKLTMRKAHDSRCLIVPLWVPGILNKADSPSRDEPVGLQELKDQGYSELPWILPSGSGTKWF